LGNRHVDDRTMASKGMPKLSVGPRESPSRAAAYVASLPEAVPPQSVTSGSPGGTFSYGWAGPGPLQSKGMCLLDQALPVHRKPNPSDCTSSERPQVATWPGPTSEPGGLIVCTRFPGGVVGPVRASARPRTRPGTSACQYAS